MDDLRDAIDRLVRAGGQLTVEGARGTVVLDQPGSRFGILEVRALLSIPPGEDSERVTAALSSGWLDPTVTHRLGREVRVHSVGSRADGALVRSRTWRVPPTLSSELADDVRAAVGDITLVDYRPIASREPRAASAAPPAERLPVVPAPTHEDIGDVPHEPRRVLPRALPAPVRAVLVLGLVAVVGFMWAGMIRGPRQSGGSIGVAAGAATGTASGRPSSMVAPTATPPPTPKPTPAPTPAPTAAPYRLHAIDASTEEPSGPASAAVDGNPMTAWRATFGTPQWIEVALDDPATVSEVMLLIAQADSGTSRHMLQVAKAGGAFEVVGVVDKLIADGEAIFFRPETPIEGVERIRIETLASPSNAGWFEVVVR